MNFRIILPYCFFLFFSLFFALSCERNNLIDHENVIEHQVFNLESRDGYLIFENQDHFLQVIKEVSNLDHDKLEEWEQQYDFVSIRTIYNQAEDAISAVKNHEDLQAFKEEWEGKIIFKEGIDISPMLEIPINKLLDIRGLLRIGDFLIKYSDNKAIIVKDGTVDQIEAIPSLPIGTFDEVKGIAVRPVTIRVIESEYNNMRDEDGETIEFRNETVSCQDKTNGDSPGSRRVDGEITTAAVSVGFNSVIITVDFLIESYYRDGFWGWRKEKSDLSIKGNGIIGGFSVSPINFTIDVFFSDQKTASGGLGALAQESPDADPLFNELCATFSTTAEDCNCTKNVTCNTCPPGSGFDGANCYFTHYPQGSNGFYLLSGAYTFYYTPFSPPNQCPHQPYAESGFDGSNCLVKWGVSSDEEVFILTSSRAFYAKPKCPCEN